MNKFKVTAVVLSTVAVMCLFSSCGENKKEEITTDMEITAEEVTQEYATGGEYIIESIDFAQSKIKENPFENCDVAQTTDSDYALFETYTDNDGNVKNIGYDDEGNVVFESYEFYENGAQLFYAEYENGVITELVRTVKNGRIDFIFENGTCTEYILTEDINGQSTIDGTYKVSHYGTNGFLYTDICNEYGEKIDK